MRYKIHFTTGKDYFRSSLRSALSFARCKLRELYCIHDIECTATIILITRSGDGLDEIAIATLQNISGRIIDC